MGTYLRWSMRSLIFLGIACLAMLLFVTDGSGKTITVDDDGGADFERIQDALEVVSDGDTIRVFTGIYYDNINVNKSINLIGNGSVNTIIESDRRDDFIIISADNVTVSGFTIRHRDNIFIGYNSGITITANNTNIYKNNFTGNMFGIYTYNNNHGIHIVNNSFYSSGVYGFFSNCLIGILSYGLHNSRIEKNIFISQFHAGISLWNCSAIEILENQFINNLDYGIELEDSHNNTIERNTIINNSVGITFKSTLDGTLKPSIDNSVHNNTFIGNEFSGINATQNNGFSVNVSMNYWGHPSGPRHPVNNTRGRGDTVTDFVVFEPWLDENGNFYYLKDVYDGEDDNDVPNRIPLFILCGFVIVLLAMIVIVVRLPRLQSTGKESKVR